MASRASRPITEITREDCDAFRADPTRNPLTGRRIDATGPTAGRLQATCDERFPVASTAPTRNRRSRSRPIAELTQEDCNAIRANPAVNPLTNNQIDPDGQTSLMIQRECDQRYPAPPRNDGVMNEIRNRFANDHPQLVNLLSRWTSQRQSNIRRIISLTRLVNSDVCEVIRSHPNQVPASVENVCAYLFPPTSIVYNGRPLRFEQVHGTIHGYLRLPENVRNTFPPREKQMMEYLANICKTQFPLSWIRHDRYIPVIEFIRQELNNPTPMNRFTPPTDFLAAIRPRFEQLYPAPREASSPRNTPKRFSSRDVPSEEIAQTCKDVFQNVAPFFKSRVNKMIKMCNQYVDRCDIARVKNIQRDTANFTYSVGGGRLTTSPDSCLMTAFKKAPEVFKHNFEDLHIRFTNQDGVGMGVARAFVQACIDDVKNVPGQPPKFFAPIYPGSQHYVINPDMTPARARQLGYANVQTEEDLNKLYTMIGTLFAFCARHDFPIPMYLARSITIRILHKEQDITPEMSVFYHIMDSDPQVMNSIVDLMRNPDDIEYVGLVIQDAQGNEVDVTKENYFDYVVDEAKTKYLHKLYENSPDTHGRLVAFLNGIYIRNKLRKNRVTVREFEKMLCGVPININTIREWTQSERTRVIVNNNGEREIYAMFKEILADMDGTVPLEEFGEQIELSSDQSSRSKSRKLKEKAFVDFFMRLMQFWTGYMKIDMDATLQVIFERNTGLPTSHTCFRQLCLPRDIRDKDDLYKRLVKAVSYVERGVGLF